MYSGFCNVCGEYGHITCNNRIDRPGIEAVKNTINKQEELIRPMEKWVENLIEKINRLPWTSEQLKKSREEMESKMSGLNEVLAAIKDKERELEILKR